MTTFKLGTPMLQGRAGFTRPPWEPGSSGAPRCPKPASHGKLAAVNGPAAHRQPPRRADDRRGGVPRALAYPITSPRPVPPPRSACEGAPAARLASRPRGHLRLDEAVALDTKVTSF